MFPHGSPPGLLGGGAGAEPAPTGWYRPAGMDGGPDPVRLLEDLLVGGPVDAADAASDWAASGAMALTGPADAPPRQAPASIVDVMCRLAERYEALGGDPTDGPALLGERAALAGMGRRGATSVGGYAHLLGAGDGVVCVNLARPDDLAALPALLGGDVDPTDWRSVERLIGGLPSAELVEGADLLGMPLGVPGTGPGRPAVVTAGGTSPRCSDRPLVVELGSLWAAPLCGDLLRRAGCRVVKVESRARPDGARNGPASFFDLLNGGKESVVVDPSTAAGIEVVRRLVSAADVVVESSRPRVMDQWGVDVEALVDAGTVWTSITGYGRDGPRSSGVAFGDDAAVSGGLLLECPSGFVADAVADPATGLLAAVLALAALGSGRGHLVDVSLAGTARWMAGGGRVVDTENAGEVAEPRARRAGDRAAPLGADTTSVMAGICT